MTQPRNNGKRTRMNTKSSRNVLLAFFGVAGIGLAIAAFFLVRGLVSSWTLGNLPGAPSFAETTPEVDAEGNIIPSSGVLQPSGGPTAQPWDGSSRVTILLLGLDYDDTEARKTPRTDTMMVVSMDPQSRTAGIMSIPRDTWTNIPGFDYAKINTAYFLGESYQLPGGGAGLAVETVESFLGVPINYYAQIDFDAFVRFIDELGGVTIKVPEKMTVSIMGGYSVRSSSTGKKFTREEKILKPGTQKMDGATALAYARNRHTGGGDFDRAYRQQQVIRAIRDKVLSLNMLPTLITKAPKLYQELSAGIHTNLNLDQIVQLALYAAQIPGDSIKYGLLGPESSLTGMSPDGQAILIPLMEEVRKVRDYTFATGGPIGPTIISGDPAELLKQEQARLSIRNGSNLNGLAETSGNYFRNMGLNVVEVGNDNPSSVSYIIDITGKPYTVSYFTNLLKLQSGQIRNAAYDPNSPVDVIVVLGNDWAQSNPMGMQ